MYSKGPAVVHHCTLSWGEPPTKRLATVVDLILFSERGQADPRHSFPSLAGGKDGDCFKICLLPPLARGERRLITEIRLTYAHNDCGSTVRYGLYVPAASAAGTAETKLGHMAVPAGFAGTIASDTGSRLVYQAPFANLDKLPVMHYLGMEERLLSETRTWVGTAGATSAYRAFEPTDPLLVFMLKNRHMFDELSVDDIRLQGPMYVVRETLVERVQRFFRTQVMPLIEYLPEDCEHLVLRKEGGPAPLGAQVALQLELDYVSVFSNTLGLSVKVTPFVYLGLRPT